MIWLFCAGVFLFLMAYWFYGGYIARVMGLNDQCPTPAVAKRDDIDFVPTPDPVLFGHHFSSIAGAGPIIGPIIAGLAFGWLPVWLWIVLGAIFVGGVHDFTAMAASLRNEGRSLGDLCRLYLPRPVYFMFLAFIIFTLLYVIIVFLDLTAAGFVPAENTAAADLRGGAVATAAVFYVVLAVAFGLVVYKWRWPLGRASLIFAPLVFCGLWLGMCFPLKAEYLPAVAGSVKNFWIIVLLGYCLIASVLPVWLLLQPRDYLSSFLLFACVIGGVAGLFGAAWSGKAVLAYPAFLGWKSPQLGGVFPALFITVACGAVSGFHALVASGTSVRQLRRETSSQRIGYGAMLVEGVLALLALGVVMTMREKVAGTPVHCFALGLAAFMETLGFDRNLMEVFGMLAVSTFLLTTLDTCTRLTRFVLSEFFSINSALWSRIAATVAILLPVGVIVFQKLPGADGRPVPAWMAIWPAFGASNQLLAALALLCVFMWLHKTARAKWFVAVPLVFMFVTTITALGQLAWRNLWTGSRIIGATSLILMLLAFGVGGGGLWAWRTQNKQGAPR